MTVTNTEIMKAQFAIRQDYILVSIDSTLHVIANLLMTITEIQLKSSKAKNKDEIMSDMHEMMDRYTSNRKENYKGMTDIEDVAYVRSLLEDEDEMETDS